MSHDTRLMRPQQNRSHCRYKDWTCASLVDSFARGGSRNFFLNLFSVLSCRPFVDTVLHSSLTAACAKKRSRWRRYYTPSKRKVRFSVQLAMFSKRRLPISKIGRGNEEWEQCLYLVVLGKLRCRHLGNLTKTPNRHGFSLPQLEDRGLGRNIHSVPHKRCSRHGKDARGKLKRQDTHRYRSSRLASHEFNINMHVSIRTYIM